jgi:hypothetical protein
MKFGYLHIELDHYRRHNVAQLNVKVDGKKAAKISVDSSIALSKLSAFWPPCQIAVVG